jgi:hypothetical protein
LAPPPLRGFALASGTGQVGPGIEERHGGWIVDAILDDGQEGIELVFTR